MPKAKQPVTISSGGRYAVFDALMKSSDGYSSTVPAYPTEEGFEVNDTIIIESPTLSMTLYLAKLPVTWKGSNGINRVEHHAAMLENLYFGKEVCVISTTEKTYSNMVIESMSIAKSEELGYDKQVDISFRKIIVTSSRLTSIPDSYGKSGATGASNGAASTTQGTSGSGSAGAGSGSSGSGSGNGKSSILYAAAEGIGLIK